MTKAFLLVQIHRTRIVALVVALVNGTWRVRRNVAVARDDSSDGCVDSWAVRLRRALGEREVPHKCILLLHRHDYAVLQIELPPGTPEETSSMLELHLADRIPTDSAGVCSGWESVAANDSDQQVIQVYWTPRDKIMPIVDALQAGGFALAGVFPALAVFRRLFVSDDAVEPTALLHQTSGSEEYACWRPGGSILFSRGRQTPNESVSANACPSTGLARELAASIGNAQSQMTMPPGSCFQIVHLGALALKSPICSTCLPESDQAVQRLTEATGRYESEGHEDFLALAALSELAGVFFAQTHSGRLATHLNMVPQEFLRQHELTRSRSLAIQASALILGIVVLATGNLWLYGYQLEQSLQTTQAEISRLTPQAKEIEAMEERIASIRDQIDYAISPTDALTQINRVLAESSALDGLFLDRMDYKATGEIAMEGHSLSDITPWKYAEALGNTGLFNSVQRPKIDTQMLGGTRSIRFALKVQTGKSSSVGNGGGEPKTR